MPIRLLTTPYGRPAAVALHAEIAAAKRDDPLAPVTVVVPANSVSVAVRRLLASGELGPCSNAGPGLVGVQFLTVLRLAELLGAAALAGAGRRPVSTPVVAGAVRSVLAAQPGMFRPVSQQPATEEALVAAHRELADLNGTALDVLAQQSRRASEVVRIHRAVTDKLAPEWYAEQDLMLAALDAIASGSMLVEQLGAIVVYLPQRLSAPAARLLRTLAEQRDVCVVAAFTGDSRADELIGATLGSLGAKFDAGADAEVVRTPAAGTHVVSVSDADDEARAVVRGVVDAMREGIPLERMAVLYSAREPYARLLHEHLELADVVHNGASVRALHESVLGRSLLRLLALPDAGFRRDDVLALLAGAPVRGAEDAWERISKVAGVVRGVDEWRLRLDEYAAKQASDGYGGRERARAERLRAFVDELVTVTQAPKSASWAAYARWCQRLVDRYFGNEARRESWPQIEQDAARRVEGAIERLAGLDAVDAAPTAAVFRRTLELELASAYDRVGRLGDGLLVGPVGYALGVDFDRVFVCGLAEGTFPAVPRDDPLLADFERAALDGDLVLRSARMTDDHRALLAALEATAGARVMYFPRGDLRRSTERVPSRYLPERPAATVEVASFTQGLASAVFPATAHEYDVRTVLTGEALRSSALERSVECVTARASREFTRFDGNLAHLGDRLARVSPTAAEAVVSATRLEGWVGCPHAYFAQYVLGIRVVERPEDIVALRPIDRGSLVHAVLDRFVAGGGRSADRDRLHEILDEECLGVERRGLAGRTLLWARDRRLLRAEVDAWLVADTRYRAARGLDTLATEFAFGPMTVALSDGRTLRFKGAADRVDRTADGRIVVVDYKTGKPDSYAGLGPDDPVGGGERLQLPLYAYAARDAFGTPDAAVEAHYWFVGRGEDRLIGYEVDSAVDEAFDTAVGAIVDGIDAGCFPARPDPPSGRPFISCHFCDPDGLGTADRWREWERKWQAPEMAPYVDLLRDGDE